MPYFRWKGMNLAGNIKKGVLRASSVSELNFLLLGNDIALLSAFQKKTTSLLNPIRAAQKVHFFHLTKDSYCLKNHFH